MRRVLGHTDAYTPRGAIQDRSIVEEVKGENTRLRITRQRKRVCSKYYKGEDVDRGKVEIEGSWESQLY